jgi:hypothetical protein
MYAIRIINFVLVAQHFCHPLPLPLTVSWSKDGRPLDTESARFKLSSEDNTFTFAIPAALSTDSGSYTVTAATDAGSSSWTFSLGVAIGDSVDEAKVQELLRSVEVPAS